jgi:hypothetical protein
MSIADNFDHKSDAGFVRAYDARAARRQFQVSSMLVLVLALSAIALGILTQLAPPNCHGAVCGGQARQPSYRGNVTGHSRLS